MVMRENPETRLVPRTDFKTRLKVAVGLGAVLAASVVAPSLASAAVPPSATVAHPAIICLRCEVSSSPRPATIGPISHRLKTASIGPISNRLKAASGPLLPPDPWESTR